MAERDNVLGLTRAGAAAPHSMFTIPLGVDVGMAEASHTLAHGAANHGQLDLAWLFGPGSGSVRVAGDMLKGFADSGQVVIYDKTKWASQGEGCVVELRNGDRILGFYEKTANSVVTVRQADAEQPLTFPMGEIRGVWAIRFRGA